MPDIFLVSSMLFQGSCTNLTVNIPAFMGVKGRRRFMSKDITLLEEIAEQDLSQVSGAGLINDMEQYAQDFIEATRISVDIGFTKNPVHFKSCKSW